MHKLLLSVAVIGLVSVTGTAVLAQKIVPPDDMKWSENPAIPKGIEVAIITGDPTKAGSVVVQRVRFTPNAIVPPHTHPYHEIVTILSGNPVFGFGEKIDPSVAGTPTGTVILNPAGTPHYVKNGAEVAVIQSEFVAPGGIDYLNPADDPRKK